MKYDGPLFPILNDPMITAIPLDVIRPHEAQAQLNHGQTLSRLAQRGGLNVVEAFLIIHDRSWSGVETPIDKVRMSAYRLELMRAIWKFERESISTS